MVRMNWCVIVIFFAILDASAYCYRQGALSRHRIQMHFEESDIGNTALSEKNLPSRKYVATNRFKVRNNQGPIFEKRWADRKSRLASLNGFSFFTLLKRVNDVGEADDKLGNYISLTVWDDKPSFTEWRTGSAFKEAHGGGGITDFVKLLTTAIFILDGGPKPAFYDCLSYLTNFGQADRLITESGWRKVETDGKTFISPDLYSVHYRFNVPNAKTIEFEREMVNFDFSVGKSADVINVHTMRRDASEADDGFNYILTINWKDAASFFSWRNANQLHVSGILGVVPKETCYEGKLALAAPRKP